MAKVKTLMPDNDTLGSAPDNAPSLTAAQQRQQDDGPTYEVVDITRHQPQTSADASDIRIVQNTSTAISMGNPNGVQRIQWINGDESEELEVEPFDLIDSPIGPPNDIIQIHPMVPDSAWNQPLPIIREEPQQVTIDPETLRALQEALEGYVGVKRRPLIAKKERKTDVPAEKCEDMDMEAPCEKCNEHICTCPINQEYYYSNNDDDDGYRGPITSGFLRVEGLNRLAVDGRITNYSVQTVNHIDGRITAEVQVTLPTPVQNLVISGPYQSENVIMSTATRQLAEEIDERFIENAARAVETLPTTNLNNLNESNRNSMSADPSRQRT